MSDVVQATVKAASSKLSDFFKNTAGQFSVEEVSKFLAVLAAVVLGIIFFVTKEHYPLCYRGTKFVYYDNIY